MLRSAIWYMPCFFAAMPLLGFHGFCFIPWSVCKCLTILVYYVFIFCCSCCFNICLVSVCIFGHSGLLPLLGKIIGVMPLFRNYIGACPCFETRLYKTRVIKSKQKHTLKSLTTPQTSQPHQAVKDKHTNNTYINTTTTQNCNKIQKLSKLK